MIECIVLLARSKICQVTCICCDVSRPWTIRHFRDGGFLVIPTLERNNLQVFTGYRVIVRWLSGGIEMNRVSVVNLLAIVFLFCLAGLKSKSELYHGIVFITNTASRVFEVKGRVDNEAWEI